jgi:uncharacterized MAPEG superfamily protein
MKQIYYDADDNMLLSLPEEYAWVIVCALVLAIEYNMFGMIMNKTRARLFNKDFMEKNFKAEHEAAFPGEALPSMGFPDTVAGRYAMKLDYKDWTALNTANRIHMNYFEMHVSLIVCTLLAGISWPWVAVGFAAVHILARIAYLVLYYTKGPDARLPAAMFVLFTTFSLHLIAIASMINVAYLRGTDARPLGFFGFDEDDYFDDDYSR